MVYQVIDPKATTRDHDSDDQRQKQHADVYILGAKVFQHTRCR